MGSMSVFQGLDLFGGNLFTEQSARLRLKVLAMSGNGRIVLLILVLLLAPITLVVLAKLLSTSEQASEETPEKMARTKCAALRLRPDEYTLTNKEVLNIHSKHEVGPSSYASPIAELSSAPIQRYEQPIIPTYTMYSNYSVPEIYIMPPLTSKHIDASARLVGYIKIDAVSTPTLGLYAPLEADALVSNRTGDMMFLELSSACSLTQIWFNSGAKELAAKVKTRVQVEGMRWDVHCATNVSLVKLSGHYRPTVYVGQAPYSYCDQEEFGNKFHKNPSILTINFLQLRIYD